MKKILSASKLFLRPREIKSSAGWRYTPLIVPPTYPKDFSRPVFRRLWNRCTDVLSTPKRLVFLGYSLPAADLLAQYIFRCGFHNQIEGRLKKDGTRYPAARPADIPRRHRSPRAQKSGLGQRYLAFGRSLQQDRPERPERGVWSLAAEKCLWPCAAPRLSLAQCPPPNPASLCRAGSCPAC